MGQLCLQPSSMMAMADEVTFSVATQTEQVMRESCQQGSRAEPLARRGKYFELYKTGFQE